MLRFTLLLFCFIIQYTFAQEELLQSGPMLGYSGFREVLIWVQTTEEAEVKIGYFKEGQQEQFTSSVITSRQQDFIAKLYPQDVEYGQNYNYKLYINDQYIARDYPLTFQTQALWQYRTNPPGFSFALGSCGFINENKDDRPNAYGDGYEVFLSIAEKQPDMMLWLGDNTYLRTPDFLTERGIRHRYKQTRSLPELQPLLASTHHYATWDDHDYGPNNSNRSYANKTIVEQVFNEYWGNLNTNVVGNGGIASHFVWNDVEFFLLDNRYHRAPNELNEKDKPYFGKEQLNWLIDALASSNASFKIVASGGQIINSAAVYENYATYEKERKELLDMLDKHNIEGVVFLSGDRHHTEISKMERKQAYPLIDITCSPFTSGTHSPRDEGNKYLVPNTSFYERNFGIANVTGDLGNRQLTLSIYDQKGDFVFDYTIHEQELKYPKRKKRK